MLRAAQLTEALSTSHLTAVTPQVWRRAAALLGETLVVDS